MFNDLPVWAVPLFSSILTGGGSIVAAVLSYRAQSKKIDVALNSANARLRGLDIDEFKAIAEGNKALRDALLDRVQYNEEAYRAMRLAHQQCEKELDELKKTTKDLEKRTKVLERINE